MKFFTEINYFLKPFVLFQQCVGVVTLNRDFPRAQLFKIDNFEGQSLRTKNSRTLENFKIPAIAQIYDSRPEKH